MADWQSLVAIGIALVCTAWMVRYVARPFATSVAQICRKCGSPAAAEETADLLQIEPPAAAEETADLLQIEPPAAPKNQP